MLCIFIFLALFALGKAHYGEDINHFKEIELISPTRGEVWPSPQEYSIEQTYMTIDPKNFTFAYSGGCDIIKQAIARYQDIIFQNGCSKSSLNNTKAEASSAFEFDTNNVGQLKTLNLYTYGYCEEYPYMDMDEQYIIKVNTPDWANSSLLYTTTVWGIVRGLETFSQMIYPIGENLFAINTSIILDFPRFSYRGLLLDTSRHFVPVPILKQNLDAMAQTKMNVFHWHIVDDQSFPYVSSTFPNLSGRGAFNINTHTYSQKDVADIVEYARLRGIRVLPEFDTPGHTLSWGNGQPDLLTKCYSGKQPNGKFGPIDPTLPTAYTFLKSLFSEVGSVFPDGYMHLGGDEVDFDCWKSNPNITSFMKKQSYGKNYALLEQYYMQNLLDIVKSFNKSYIVWQEVFDNNVKVKPDTVIHVWKDNYQNEMSNVTAAGYKTILSSCWYLNYISYGDDWKNYYKCDPYNFTGNDNQKHLVVGGEACMWGEYVDGSNVLTRTWPRAAAVAERLWSNQKVNDTAKAAPRLEEVRCNMIKRGLKVEPVSGPGFCECDYLV